MSEQTKHVAGRVLDAEVAERVMGWTRHPEKMHPTDNRTIGGVLYCPPGHPCDAGGVNVVPAYSTDIAVAWQVVEKLKDRASKVSVFCERGAPWAVYIHLDRERFSVYERADTVPLAICRAALETLDMQ